MTRFSLLAALLAATQANAQTAVFNFTRSAVPDAIPARVGPAVIANTLPGLGSGIFIGGRDADGALLTSATQLSATTAASVSFAVSQPAAFTPLEGGAIVPVGTIGLTTATNDARTFVLGGGDLLARTGVNVAVYDASSATWTASLTVDGAAPPNRQGAAAVYLRQCNTDNPSAPIGCIVMFGGSGRTGLLNDVWALWLTTTPRPRWTQLVLHTTTNLRPGQATPRTGAVGAASSDGTTMYIYGGTTSAGPTSDVFAFAPAGFSDPRVEEMTNVARDTMGGRARNSTWSALYATTKGAVAIIDGLTNAQHSTNGQQCSHSDQEFAPWLGVQLNGTFPIAAIRLIPRSDGSFTRTRNYRMFLSQTDPNAGPWPNGGPPYQLPDTEILGTGGNAGLPNIINVPVTITLAQPRLAQFFWFALRNIGTNTDRFLSLCEVELYVKAPNAWRQLSGVDNVALNKDTRQSSVYAGAAQPSYAVDGRTNNNNLQTTPFTCSHTAGNGQPNGQAAFWQVDLGDVYDITNLNIFPRTDCCTANRLRDWSVYAGLSRNGYTTSTLCSSGPLRQPNGNLVVDLYTGGVPVTCATKARWITVHRPNNYGTVSADNSVISICEFQAFAERMPNLPSPRRDFSYTMFRGFLVIFGGSDARGFRQGDIRFFNLDTRAWLPPLTPVGAPPSPRALAGLALLGPDTLAIHGGSTAADASPEATLVTFPSCPVMAQQFQGVQDFVCTQGGTVCSYVCLNGFVDRNAGQAVECRLDGTIDGVLPPCVQPSVPLAPTGLVVSYNGTTALATVSWTAPTSGGVLGWYGTQSPGVTALRQTRVRAMPAEHLEFFTDGFENSSAWFLWNGNRGTNLGVNSYYFQGGRLLLSAGPQTEYWGTLIDNSTGLGLTAPMDGRGFIPVATTTRTALVMVRDWPSTVDPAGEWAMETEIEALGQMDGSTFSLGLMDMGLNGRLGEMHFQAGVRYTDAAGFGIQLESLGGRTTRNMPSKSNRMFFRIERVLFSERDYQSNVGVPTGAGLYRVFYKYTAGARWVRIYDAVTYREMLGMAWDPSTNTMTGLGGQPSNLRPMFMAKSTANNDFSRATAAFKYLKITAGLGFPSPGTARLMPNPLPGGGTANVTTIAGLTPGSRYIIEVAWQTVAGFGAPARFTLDVPALPSASGVVQWGTREVANQRPAWLSSQYATAWAANGNDGNWLGAMFHSGCTTNGEWWAVDLGVDYAAVKHIIARNRCDAAPPGFNVMRLRHFQVYVGQDGSGARTTNPMIDQWPLWDNFTMQDNVRSLNRENGITNFPVRHLGWGRYDPALQRAVPMAYTATDWGTNPSFCQFQIPTPGYGRYLYLANGQGTTDGCLHLSEIQVFTTNTCPLRTATGGAVAVTTGGRGCDLANNRFGRQCEFTCPTPLVHVAGTRVVTCNGETWVGGPALPVQCGLECTALDAPAFSSRIIHTILDENFVGITAAADRLNRIGSLNPIGSPWAQNWAFVDNTLQSVARIGREMEATAVFAIEKIRILPRSSAFSYSAVFTTNEPAGLLFRIQDGSDMDYYRVFADPSTGVHGVDAMVSGIPTEVGRFSLSLDPDASISLQLDVDGEFFNVTINGRATLSIADGTFSQGYVGLFAQGAATFTAVRFTRVAPNCEGVTAGETCTVECQSGLQTVGSATRTCLANGGWTGVAPVCTVSAPTFPPATLAVRENSARNTLVGNPLAASSPSAEYPVSYTVLDTYNNPPAGPGAAIGPDWFSVDFCSGQVKVRRQGFLDFESMRSYLLLVRAYIQGFPLAFSDRNITVNVIDVDEPPMVNRTTYPIAEGTASGSVIGRVQVIDPENSPVSFNIDVDGSNGRIGLNRVTGDLFIAAAPGNRTGFPSMSTGADAPFNFEGMGPMDIVISVRQTAGDTSLTGTGTVTVVVTDANDPPILYPDQVLYVQEAAFSVSAVVGTPSTLDEDTRLPATSFTQVDPVQCGETRPLRIPNTAAPPGSTTFALTGGSQNNLFTVDPTTGEISVRVLPTQTYAANGGDTWPVFLATGKLVRALYTVCLSVTDGTATVIAPVTVAVVADTASSPTVTSVTPALFPTAGATQIWFEGANFWPSFPGGTAPPLAANYSNGVDSFSATGCRVWNNTHMSCVTVPGVGGAMAWSFNLNSRAIMMSDALYSSYIPPFISTITGHTGMPTQGRAVTMTGTNLGPLGTRRVTVQYGPSGREYACAVSAAVGNHTTLVCTSSGEAGGTNLQWSVSIGGQAASLAASLASSTWSYAGPVLTSITAASAPTFALDRLSTTGGQDIALGGLNFGGLTVDTLVTYGGASGTTFTLPCRKDAVTAHTRLTCTIPAGVGKGHAVMIAVAGITLTGPFMAGSGTGLAYMTPVISQVYGPGWKNADTVGSQEITIVGNNFGPAALVPRLSTVSTPTIDSVTYGVTGDTTRYSAINCRIVQEGNPGQISCLSAPGVGRGLRLALSIGGQAANHTGGLWPEVPQVATLSGSYAPPTIIAFSGAGSSGADTLGSQDVFITGRNFGPADTYTASRLSVLYSSTLQAPIKDVTGAVNVITNVTYIAASCVITTAHTEIKCSTAPGAGTGLAWDVTVAGQKSATPTTSYAAPVISAVALEDALGNAVGAAAVDGGTIATLSGAFFGPAVYAAGRSLVQSITFGTLGTEYSVPASAWRSVTQSTIKVTLPPAMGINLLFRVTVADQMSTSDPSAVFSYALPDILFLDPQTVSTYSDPRQPTIVTVVARNLPLKDPLARITLAFGNVNPRIITPVLPQGTQAVARATNVGGPFDGAVNFSFPVPTHAGGVDVGVSVRLTRPSSTTVAASSAVTPASSLQFRNPIIDDVVVTRALWTNGANSSSSPDAVPCPFTGSSWLCSDPAIFRLDILGRDFTSDSTDWADGVARTMELYLFTDIFGGQGDVYSATPLWKFAWEHTKITYFSRLSSGRLRMNITSVGPDGRPRLQQLIRPFQDQSPLISAVTGPTSNIPTVGARITDPPLVLTVEALTGATSVTVQVGPFMATLLEPAPGGGYRPIANVGTWLSASNNPQNNGNIWTLYVQLPAGQGKDLPILVTKTSGAGVQGSNTGYTVSYAAPVLQSVQIVVRGTAGPVVPIDAFTMVEVPTDGSSARVRLYGSNLGVAPFVTAGDAVVLTAATGAVVPCTLTVVPTDHTCYEFVAPEGEGDGTLYPEYQPLGYRLKLTAGAGFSGQDTAGVGFRYTAPSVTSVTSSTGRFPTLGGPMLTFTGVNFGYSRPGRTPAVSLSFRRTDGVPALVCADLVRVSHTMINCTLPQGSGDRLSVTASVAGLTTTSSSIFSYDSPVIYSISVRQQTGFGNNRTWSDLPLLDPLPGFNRQMASGQTGGGDYLIIQGENFGTQAAQHCAFLTWSHRRLDAARVHTCNGGEDFLGEGEVEGQAVFSWNDTRISLRTPPGIGFKDIELSIRGRTTGIAQYDANLWRFQYAAPVITTLRDGNPPGNSWFPTGDVITAVDTDGGETVTIWGQNLGPSPLNGTRLSEVFSPALPLSQAPSMPTAYVVIVFHRACITQARTLFGARPETTVSVNGINQPMTNCDNRVLRQEHGRIAFLTGAGIGKNRTMSIVVVDGPQAIVSNTLSFGYKAPDIQSFSPNLVLFAGEPSPVDIFGRYFGNAELADSQGWTAEERAVGVAVGGFDEACKTTVRRRESGNTIIGCTVDDKLVPAGYRNVSLTVAGQVGFKPADDPVGSLLVVCASGYYGRVNETCWPCPAQSEDANRRGANCPGYVRASPTFEGRFSYPRPLKGWYNLNSSDIYTQRVEGSPSMLGSCPPGFQDGNRDVCIVPCDPADSCLGDNHCAEGYTSKPPMWRCASCDKGFYKRAGECIKCPDSPGALFVGFAVLVIFVACVGFLLNKKQVNIAVLSIGVDFFQVLAIFAQARVKWPPVVKELLHVLSAFNLNIEIVAPECLIPDVSYKQKFWFIMLLPLCIISLFAVVYLAMLINKAIIKGRPKSKWHTHSPAMVSSGLVLVYLLYLYLTRTIMDVFSCSGTVPPDGKLYLQVVFEECGIPGGTQMTLLGYAIAGVIVYVAGYPAFIGMTLFKNRELVMEDQLLRAKGLGNDRLSNPHAYQFRRTFGRSYFQFKPDWCLWILAIIFRKFLIAITAVVFAKNSSFQMAACLLIMFLAYAAQVQIRPYMSPGDFDEVLKSHLEASYTSAVHARLRSALAGIETRGRKKAHKQLITVEGKIDRNAVFGVLTGFFFNYNTVEAIMTFCAVIVCLMAIMYQANELNTAYPESKDSVTSVVLIIVIWAIVYFFTVVITEIVVLYNEDNRSKQLAKAARASKGKDASDSSGAKAGGRRSEKLVDGEGELNLGKVEQATNPLFLRQDGKAASGMAGNDSTVEAILAQQEAPPVELWRVFQAAYADSQAANKSLAEQLQAAKKQLQQGAIAGTAVGAMGEEGPVRGGRSTSKTQFGPRASIGGENPMMGGKSGGLSMAGIRKAARPSAGAASSE